MLHGFGQLLLECVAHQAFAECGPASFVAQDESERGNVVRYEDIIADEVQHRQAILAFAEAQAAAQLLEKNRCTLRRTKE